MELAVWHGTNRVEIQYDSDDGMEVLHLQIGSLFCHEGLSEDFKVIDYLGRVVETQDHLKYLDGLCFKNNNANVSRCVIPCTEENCDPVSLWLVDSRVELQSLRCCTSSILSGDSCLQPSYQ